ncbi:SRPBCC family protein [Rhodococcus triatomae]
MTGALKEGDTVVASTVVRATPKQVYAVVSDVRRIPEWSPECVRVDVIGDSEFRGYNQRRFGKWSTRARIVTADADAHEFAFRVQLAGRDFTQWTYSVKPNPDGCELIEEFRMCMDLPFLALAFERVALGVKDRRSDLKGNLDLSLRRLREIIELETQQEDRR